MQNLSRLFQFFCFLLALLPSAMAGNALDRIDFGNATSENVHQFQPGTNPANLPPSGTGAFGRTYRAPLGDGVGFASGTQGLTFTLGCDSTRQNYLTIKLWGNDLPAALSTNNLAFGAVQYGGGAVAFPNRFYYLTLPIPLTQTQGLHAVSLNILCSGLAQGALGQPIYSAFTHTAPRFEPETADLVGSAPARSGQLTTYPALTSTAALNILKTQRQSLYNSGGYYDQVLGNQIPPGQAGAPLEVIGLDMRTNVASWVAANPGATATQWRDYVGTRRGGPGYSIVPDELLSVLGTTYLLPPFRDASNNIVAGLDHYHDATVLRRTVAALDGSTYLRAVDGGFGNTDANYGEWLGVTSTPRVATSHWPGTTSRQGPWSLSLEGVDSQSVGFTILNLLNDPAMPASGGTSNPANFVDYLGQTIDGTLQGGNTLRASVYEQMLYDHINYLGVTGGGTESQNLFQMLGLYASQVALQKLQTLFPNAAYNSPVDGLSLAKMVMGIIPEAALPTGNYLGGTYPGNGNPLTNYGLSPGGLGEAHGALSCGFDGGGYGQILSWLTPRFAQLAALDSNVGTADRAAFVERAIATVDSMDKIISPQDNATVTNGALTANSFVMAEEPFITYRSTKNINSNSSRWNLNAQFLAADPGGLFAHSPSLRSTYLNTQYNLTPTTGASAGNGTPGGALNYLRDLPAYEASIRALIGRDPATLTPLPGEPGQPDFAWADVRSGAVALINQGERVYMNVNWRNFETNNNSFTGLVPSQILRIHDTTGGVERAAQVYLPSDTTRVQADGNLSGASMNSAFVARYGDYLIVLNNGIASYAAKLPAGFGQAQDLLTKNFYNLGATVTVPAGQAAVLWLAASTTQPGGAGSPTVATAAAASASTVSGTSVNLSVLGTDDGGEAALTYTWALAGGSPAPVLFSANNSNAAKNTAVTFNAAGRYDFVVVIKDAGGLATSSPVTVNVAQTPGSVTISPAAVTLPSGGTQTFTGLVNDQFGLPLLTPTAFSWTLLSGAGELDDIGRYTAPAGSGGTASVRLTAGSLGATASVTVLPPVGVFTGSTTVGSPSPIGSATFSNGVYTLQSGSGDAYGAADGLRYVFQPFAGDGVMTARVVSITNTASNVKAGIMFRNSLAANSANAFAYATPATNYGVGYNWRLTDGASTGQVNLTGRIPAQWLRLTRAGNTFKAENASDVSGAPGTWTQIGSTQIIAGNEVIQAGLALAGINSAQPTAMIDNFSLVPATRTIFPIVEAIGGSNGGTSINTYAESGSTVTMSGQGGDIWNNADNFQFACVGINGDSSVTARVVSNTALPASSKVGVMIRDTLEPGSRQASTLISPSGSIRFGRRTSTNGSSAENTANTYAPPYWLRMVRSGNTFSSYTSPDGITWNLLGSQSITMGRTVLAGLAVASLDGANATTVVFDHITVGGAVNQAPTLASPPAASVSGLTASLGALGADDGGEANLTYNWYLLGNPPGSLNLSANGSNAAKNTTATFGTAGIYYFQLVVTDGGGLTVSTDDLSVIAGTITPPLAPGSLTATGSSASIGLTWDVSGGATTYRVKRSFSSTSGFTTIASSLTNFSYTDNSVTAGIYYFYKVSAVNSGGESSDSAVASAITTSASTTTLTSIAAQDGYVRASSSANTSGGTAYATTTPGRLGDDSSNRQYKAFFSFDTSTLPTSATVTGAILRWKRSALTGTSPFSVLGNCYADLKGGSGFNNNAALETADFAAAADVTQAATMSNPANNGDLSSGAISTAAMGFLNRTGNTQFRVYFSTPTNSNSSNDYLSFSTSEDSTAANRPVLEVTTTTPTTSSGLTLTNRATGGTASASSDNPPAEGADKAFDGISAGGSTKWFTSSVPPGWLQYHFANGSAWAVVRYDLTSGNDLPGRDPQAWQFQGSNDGTTWTTLDNRSSEIFSGRGQTRTFNVANSERFAWYRLNITANAGGSGFGLQLAEMALLAYAPPAAPANLTATAGTKQIAVSWSAVSNAVGYNVQVATSPGGPFTLIASGISATNFLQTGLPDGSTWDYNVSAIGAGGPSDPAAISATTYTSQENWRLAYFGTIANTGSAADTADPDGDGQTNAAEFSAGTDPNDAGSTFEITQLEAGQSGWTVKFPTVLGKTYRLESSSTLQSDSWRLVRDNIAGTGGVVQISDPGSNSAPQLFYRAVLIP